MNSLPRIEFDKAVKDALRHYTQSDLLVGNRLLETQLMTRRGSTVQLAQDLRALLAESAEALFANGRDEKIYRVIQRTYFDPAPKQEAVADRLGLSFSTYRRYLGSGIGRMIDYLWNLERDSSPERLTPPDATVQTTVAGDNRHPDSRRPLSLIVLPFLNLSPDIELGYLVDGVVDNLMTDLYRALPGSCIVSRSTAFTYKGRDIPARQIGDELRVRYVLEGSVMADPAFVRVNVQLIDARTDEHLWAERFDKNREDILQLHDEIVVHLSHGVAVEMLRLDALRDRATGA